MPQESPGDKNANRQLIEKALAVLKQKDAGMACEFCKKSDFIVASEFVALVCLDAKNNSLQLGSHFPCVALFCKNCGNTKLFNAGALGILKND